MKNPIRILQISGDIRRDSGIMNVILNWHQHIDCREVQFDYLIFFPFGKDDYEKEILKLGGRIYQLSHPYKNPIKFLRESYYFFKTHHYMTIHSHITHLNFFFYPIAKLFGAKNIIQHAHGTKWSDNKFNGWRNYLMLHVVWPLITHKLACSQLAGQFWYKKNFMVINNGIDVEKFAYNPAIRDAKRKELGVENNFAVANVGRFNLQKNHRFLVEIFAEIVKKDETAKLLLVGKGPLEEDIKTLVADKKLQDKVFFLGVRKDVPQLLQAFDVLCMPSFYEGLPVVGVEAQASGCPVCLSENISQEAKLLPNSLLLPLNAGAQYWAEKILLLHNYKRVSGSKILQEKCFDILKVARQMENFYRTLKR